MAPVMLDVEQVHVAELSAAVADLAAPLQLPPALHDSPRCLQHLDGHAQPVLGHPSDDVLSDDHVLVIARPHPCTE